MALPQSDISGYDIQQGIGDTSDDLGMLCKSDNINPWSKCKPFFGSVLFHDTIASLLSDLSAHNYGLSIPQFATPSSITGSEEWTYDRPTGGASSPYDPGDFRGYLHTAIPAVIAPAISVGTSQSNPLLIASGSCTFHLSLAAGMEPDGNLKVNDLWASSGVHIGDLYPACAVFDSGGNALAYACGDSVLYDGSTYHDSVTVDFSGFSISGVQQCTIKFFLCGSYFAQKTSWGEVQNYQICLPYISGQSIPVQDIWVSSASAVSIIPEGSIGTTVSCGEQLSDHVTASSALDLGSSRSPLFVKFRVINRLATSYTLNSSDILAASLNWAGVSINHSVSMYSAAGAAITSIQLAAGGSSDFVVRFYFGWESSSSQSTAAVPASFPYTGQRTITLSVTGVTATPSVSFYVKTTED